MLFYRFFSITVLFIHPGFPCTQFMNQEPGTESEIKEFVCTKYKATFDMTKKINVNGGDAHPLWEYMKKKQVRHCIISNVSYIKM
jgi:glutathione peroxidase-family protein